MIIIKEISLIGDKRFLLIIFKNNQSTEYVHLMIKEVNRAKIEINIDQCTIIMNVFWIIKNIES